MRQDGLIVGIHAAVVVRGTVFLNVDHAAARLPLAVECDHVAAPVEECSPGELAAAEGRGREDFDVHRLAASARWSGVPASAPSCAVDQLAGWALTGVPTLQVMLPAEGGAPGSVAFNHRLTVPSTGGRAIFRARIAAHRARAELRLLMRDPGCGEEVCRSVEFAPGFHGGPVAEGYQDVSIPLPQGHGALEVGIELSCTGRRDDGSEGDIFLFLAEPRIEREDTGEGLARPLRVTLSESMGEVWVKAALPAIAGRNARLFVSDGTRRMPLHRFDAPVIRLRENHGHTLVFDAERPIAGLVVIDGRETGRIELGPDGGILRVPRRYLDGLEHHIAIREASGTAVLFETSLVVPAILTPRDILQRETPPPHPLALMPETPARYAALRAHLRAAPPESGLARVAAALEALEAGHEAVRLRPLSFPEVDAPDVSVIIPAHNKVRLTYSALAALLLAHNEASFEVIVVDDGSTDETRRLERIVSGIRVIRNRQPQRFIRACNAGAAAARGCYIALLNNDTEVTAGWLDALIEAFERFPDAGLVGSKLLYPDGTLQDAGGIVWRSGNPWNYGRGENPQDPRFCYARQVDYVSGAALMTTREIWQKVGGLSAELEPMYFEDTDLAFKVRAAGHSVWFVPSSVVYHHEGKTSGTDPASGFKRFQEVNRPKFKRRWAREFRAFGPEGENPDLEKDRGISGRVLFIDYTTPLPNRDAGSYAAVQEMRLVRSLGYKVTFLPQNLAHFGSQTDELQRDGIEVITAPFFTSVDEFLAARGGEFDAAYVTRYHVGAAVIPLLRRHAPRARIILNNADLHFLRQLRAAIAANDADRLAEARAVREEELAVMRSADLVLSYNEVEHSVIQSHTDGAVRVMTCPWVVAAPARVPPARRRRGMSFLGNFRHLPNLEAMRWFVREVMPALEGTDTDTTLSIYGAAMPDEVRAMQSSAVRPVGFVEDVADAFDRHRIFVAPLQSGAGIKGKVLSALSHGIPCILSPVAAEGIGLRHGHDCLIATAPREWCAAIRDLAGNDDLWARLSENGRHHVEEAFSFARGREMMRAALEAVELFGAPA